VKNSSFGFKKCILQRGARFHWILDMLEIKTISAWLPYGAQPYIPVMSFTISLTFSVTLAVCMTHILETQIYWSSSLPSPLMEADFAFVKEMYCAWMTMCMQVCSECFHYYECAYLLHMLCENYKEQFCFMKLMYLLTLFALRHSHILLHWVIFIYY
jgi:hypothetical protein